MKMHKHYWLLSILLFILMNHLLFSEHKNSIWRENKQRWNEATRCENWRIRVWSNTICSPNLLKSWSFNQALSLHEDKKQDEICHATSNLFHGSNVQRKMPWGENICWMLPWRLFSALRVGTIISFGHNSPEIKMRNWRTFLLWLDA